MSSRYFEDVHVDEELEPREKMPTEEMAIEFFGANNPMNPAFADAQAGNRLGVGGALVPGVLKIAWMMQYIADWAGPEGTLRNIRVAYRRPDVAGKPLVLAGRVVDKREEDGRKMVELEVVTLAEGQPSVRGNVQIELPSRA